MLKYPSQASQSQLINSKTQSNVFPSALLFTEVIRDFVLNFKTAKIHHVSFSLINKTKEQDIKRTFGVSQQVRAPLCSRWRRALDALEKNHTTAKPGPTCTSGTTSWGWGGHLIFSAHQHPPLHLTSSSSVLYMPWLRPLWLKINVRLVRPVAATGFREWRPSSQDGECKNNVTARKN